MAETASDRGAERLHLRTYIQYSGWFIPHQHRQPPYPRVGRLHIILNGEGAPHVHLLRWSIGPGQLQTTVSYVLRTREFVREPYTDAQRSCHVEGNPANHWKFTTRRGATKHFFLSARSPKTPPSKADTKQKQESGYVTTWVPQA
jgi:hypothetical protein